MNPASKYRALLPVLKQAKRWHSMASRARHAVDRGSSIQTRTDTVAQAASAERRAWAMHERAREIMASDLDDRLDIAADIYEQIRLLAVAASHWVAECKALISPATQGGA